MIKCSKVEKKKIKTQKAHKKEMSQHEWNGLYSSP